MPRAMASTTFRLRTWTRFHASPEEVWAWKINFENNRRELWPHDLSLTEAGALDRALAGPWPVDLRATFRVLGLPPTLEWPIRVDNVIDGRQFRDTSSNPLFRRFEHTHLVEPTGDGCRYVDDLVFTPAWPTQKLAAILTQRTFVRRHHVAAKVFRADPQATAVSVLRVEG